LSLPTTRCTVSAVSVSIVYIVIARGELIALAATIYTSDIARALRIASRIEAGTVGINSAFSTAPQTPFGGFKQSGYGRESGPQALKEYVQAKSIHINMNVPPPAKL